MTHTPAQQHDVALAHQVIRASAGTGKTYRLTVQYLKLLVAGADPAAILATTFTRKAAGEILGRVLERLADAAADAQERDKLTQDLALRRALTADDCRALLRRVVASLHRVSICTIDSFFHRIAGAFRLELDLPVEPRLLDEGHPLAGQVRRDAVEAMLGAAADDDARGGGDAGLTVMLELLRRTHHDMAVRSVTGAIDDLVRELYDVYRQAPAAAAWGGDTKPAGLLDDAELVDAIAALGEAGVHLPTTAKGEPNATWRKAWEKDLARARARDWRGLVQAGLAKPLALGVATYYKTEIPEPLVRAYEPIVTHARSALRADLAWWSRATHELLQRYDGHIGRLRREQRVVLFSDLTHKLARELPLTDPTLWLDIFCRLDGQVHHLLLDEFQDTSLEQWRVLGPLADAILDQGESAASGRSFFCVGDTKQAIYGWRGGCAALFDVVEQKVITAGGTREGLDESRRCAPPVLDAVNAVFDNLAACPAMKDDADAAGDWQRAFPVHSAFDKDAPGYVRLETTPGTDVDHDDDDDEAGDDHAPHSHEAHVAEVVARVHAQAPRATLGVLVRRNRTASRLLFELRRKGLAVSGEGGGSVADAPAVAAVLSALTLADHPGDSAAGFHVANSPLGELLGMDVSDEPSRVRVAQTIRRALLDRGYPGLIADWTQRLAPACDERDLHRLTQLIDLADQHTPMTGLRPSEFVAYVDSARVEEPTPAPIRVMTIHAAKGLEFDAVVLADLNLRLSNDFSILLDRDGPTGDVRQVVRNVDSALRDVLPELQEVYDCRRREQRLEDLCNLYVAMTRPRHALHMVIRPLALTGKGTIGAAGWTDLSYATMLRRQLSRLGDAEAVEGGEVLYEHDNASAVGPWYARFAATGERAATRDAPTPLRPRLAPGRRSWRTVSPSSLEAGGKVRASELLRLEADAALDRGTLVHAWLERVAFVDDEPLPDDAALLAVGRQLLPGASAAWLEDQLARWREQIAAPAVRAALSRAAETSEALVDKPPVAPGGTEEGGQVTLWREKPFAVHEGDDLVRGLFDRVVIRRDAAGEPVAATLLDFKTDRVAADDPAELAARVEHYRPQLAAYRRALARLLDLAPDAVAARLVLLEIGRVVDVADDAEAAKMPADQPA
ncbi:MAG: UvrD-helicase domain-containing protein [Phycisphaeraceae bacterium]